MGVGKYMAPLIMLTFKFNFKLEDEIDLLPSPASTSTLAEVSLIITIYVAAVPIYCNTDTQKD